MRHHEQRTNRAPPTGLLLGCHVVVVDAKDGEQGTRDDVLLGANELTQPGNAVVDVSAT
jgi:hypothetical protein